MIFFRELCLQIGKECRKFIKAVGGARVVCVYGRSIILKINMILNLLRTCTVPPLTHPILDS